MYVRTNLSSCFLVFVSDLCIRIRIAIGVFGSEVPEKGSSAVHKHVLYIYVRTLYYNILLWLIWVCVLSNRGELY